MPRPFVAFPEYFQDLQVQASPTGDRSATGANSAVGRPASWGDPLPLTTDDAVTTRADLALDASELLDVGAIDLSPDAELLKLWMHPAPGLKLSAEVIAEYRPWHLYDEDWGIYVSEEALTAFAEELAQLTGTKLEQLAPLALRGILAHEWTHFAFEVVGAEIGDALGRVVYPSYFTDRFDDPDRRYSNGPVEEIVASWAEVEYARNPSRGFRRLRPPGYTRAVEHYLARCDPGYSEWYVMDNPADAPMVVGRIASLIADRLMASYRWVPLRTMRRPRSLSTGSVIRTAWERLVRSQPM
jgi:hypothetical protein